MRNKDSSLRILFPDFLAKGTILWSLFYYQHVIPKKSFLGGIRKVNLSVDFYMGGFHEL